MVSDLPRNVSFHHKWTIFSGDTDSLRAHGQDGERFLPTLLWVLVFSITCLIEQESGC